MKAFSRWFLMVLVVLAVVVTAVAQDDVVAQVKETIKAGSAKELVKYFNQTVDISLDANTQTYSKTQAEFVLRDFFKQNPPSEFSIVHQGSSKGGLPYAIGQYKSGGNAYRVFIKIKTVDRSQLVHEISFSKE